MATPARRHPVPGPRTASLSVVAMALAARIAYSVLVSSPSYVTPVTEGVKQKGTGARMTWMTARMAASVRFSTPVTGRV